MGGGKEERGRVEEGDIVDEEGRGRVAVVEMEERGGNME